MFKLFKKKKDKQTLLSQNDQLKDDCPMCHVSDELVKSLKNKNEKEIKSKNDKSCCN